MKDAEFRASFDHLTHSLDNAQATIRFVDKKIGSAMVLLTAVLGFVFPKYVDVKIVFGAWQSCVCGKVCAGVLVVTGCVCGILLLMVLYYVAVAMSPRPPHGPWSGGKWLLFPFWKTLSDGVDYDKVTKSKITTKGIEHKDILSEFQEQLCVLGGIVAIKMDACSKMFKCMCLLFCASAAFIMVALVAEWSALYRQSVPNATFRYEWTDRTEMRFFNH